MDEFFLASVCALSFESFVVAVSGAQSLQIWIRYRLIPIDADRNSIHTNAPLSTDLFLERNRESEKCCAIWEIKNYTGTPKCVCFHVGHTCRWNGAQIPRRGPAYLWACAHEWVCAELRQLNGRKAREKLKEYFFWLLQRPMCVEE